MAASLKKAIEWIASEDALGDNEDIETLSGYISVLLVADLFDKEANDIAKRVWQLRNKKKSKNSTAENLDRVIARLNHLFGLYEKYSNVDCIGNETSQKANDYWLEGLNLQDQAGIHNLKQRGYRKLF
jgi:hypothetical protein